ncbi:putative molybdenum carrier protein [Dictyobacter arantiisoli]|uniref:Molybdenum cofactor carrier n=1 Tax=Dictyobacter arantiisoli TaxID=2014874 RepID=A0A5A5TG58_9CHLR|nr:putative molybdenum carrier protein [Dictyobacter arantiisoli]GCF09989.1 hypothetical protein KDI_35530 [Dictyobacter arantiisoli]
MQGKHLATVIQIVSGGQTGADRAALDWAIQQGIAHGGWCPRGRRADEAAPIDMRYHLRETPSDEYAQRTEWNVRDSDGTVIFTYASALTGGSALTLQLAQQYQKPALHIHQACEHPADLLLTFLRQHNIHILNIAGPRAASEPDIGPFVIAVLDQALQRIA